LDSTSFFGRFILDAKIRARTEYAVTGRRAIIISGFFTRKVRSINLRSTPEITLTEKADGSGTITFGAAQPFNWWMQGNLWFPGTASQAAFEMIENVRRVNGLIDKAKRS
jgi:PH (Pleckstrin Homology) domain-containing protein